MELANTSALPALALVSQVPDEREGDVRLCSLFAKASYETSGSGRMSLAQTQTELRRAEEPSLYGVLPVDVVPPRAPGLDIAVLGAAYAPGGRPVEHMVASIQVGDWQSDLLITGDRVWSGQPDGTITLGPPEPFLSVPLSWERAFGGRAEVWLDSNTAVDIEDPTNPDGRGFDAHHTAMHQLSALRPPEGFPRVVGERLAPNVEHPSVAIRSSQDTPKPASWAPIPIGSPLRTLLHRTTQTDVSRRDALHDASKDGAIMRVAIPELRHAVPLVGTPFTLSGCSPDGSWRFVWPSLRVVADYFLAGRTGEFTLQPTTLLLFPEQRRAEVTFAGWFKYTDFDAASERSLRIRTEE